MVSYKGLNTGRSLGTYAFEKGNWTSSVKIDGSRSKGTLFADAIILVPKK